MKEKKEVLMIDNDLDFVSKVEESLKNKVNIISVENIEDAISLGNSNQRTKDSEIQVTPDLIIVGDGYEIPTNLKNKIKENFPKAYNEKMVQTFLPLFYCKLLQEIFQTYPIIKPKACICANLELYPFDGYDQDITKKLGYCIQNNIPLMNKTEENKELMVAVLSEHICKKCGIQSDKNYR